MTVAGNTITNSSPYSDSAAVIVAYYDARGVLTNVTGETFTFAANGEEGDSYTVTATGEGTRKIYVWNSLKGMKPLAK